MSHVPQFTPVNFLAVGLGAVIGAWLRWGAGVALNSAHEHMPYGTLAVNLVGGLLVGLALAWLARHPELAITWRLFFVTGFLGALTTFSAFSGESLLLIQRGEYGWALGHTLLHVAGSLGAAALGYRWGVG